MQPCMKKYFRTKNILSDEAPWPKFTEYEDCIFRTEDFSSENYRYSLEFARRLGAGKMAVESLMNRVLVFECFINAPAKVTPRLAREACETIRDSWRTKLRLDFPGREFKVIYAPDHPPGWWCASFCQPKHGS